MDDLCYQVLLVVAKTREAQCKYSLFTIAKENRSTQTPNVYRRDNVLDFYSNLIFFNDLPTPKVETGDQLNALLP